MSFPAGYCINRKIEDAFEMRELALKWSMEMLQFGKGRFHGDLQAIHTENLQLSSGWRSTAILVRGHVPHECVTLTTVLTPHAAVHFRGAPIEDGQIAALRHGEEIEMSTRGGARLLSVSVDAALLEKQAQALLGLSLDHLRIHERLQLCHADRHGRLNRALLQYLEFGMSSGMTAIPESCRRLENRILETILSNVGYPRLQIPRPQRLYLAKMAEEYLRAHADTPVSIAELCEITGINQRTLFLGFHERYGLSPIAYLKLLRLNAARRELLRATRGDSAVSVTRSATKWGFFHLGRFAMEYRALFGESPQQTLKRPSAY